MKVIKLVTLVILLMVFTISAVAQDTFRFSVSYKDNRVPVVGYDHKEDPVKGFSAEADVKLFKLGPVRGSLAYNFEQRNDVEVYSDYMVPCPGPVPAEASCEPMVVDLYRNVQTHYIGGQLGLSLGEAVEPFFGYFAGTQKIHENAVRQAIQKVRVGVNVPFTKKSKIFAKASLDFDKPFGSPEGGFTNPDDRSVNIGLGIRF